MVTAKTGKDRNGKSKKNRDRPEFDPVVILSLPKIA
jgi:hypothetical protein